jgi:hypothetical protein
VSAFDEVDWPPIRVLAWMWLHDRTVVDDPKLNTLRLAIHGRHAPIEMPAPDPIEPAGLDLAQVLLIPNPALKTLHAVEEEILALSRSGRLRWWGRDPDTGRRKKIPKRDFVDHKIDYDTGRLERAGSRDREEFRHRRVIWHGLRAKRDLVLELSPEASTVAPAPAAQPAPPPRSDQEIVLDYIAAEVQAGRKPRLSGCHSQHPDMPLERLRAVWPVERYPLRRGRPPKA